MSRISIVLLCLFIALYIDRSVEGGERDQPTIVPDIANFIASDASSGKENALPSNLIINVQLKSKETSRQQPQAKTSAPPVLLDNQARQSRANQYELAQLGDAGFGGLDKTSDFFYVLPILLGER